jgi:hypothetical protein
MEKGHRLLFKGQRLMGWRLEDRGERLKLKALRA